MRRPLVSSLPIALLAACASPGAGDRAADTVVIRLAFEPPETCRASLGGQEFALPANEGAFSAALRSRAKESHAASVAGGEAIPYKCFGHAVFLAQQAGFGRVGFIAEPPPAP